MYAPPRARALARAVRARLGLVVVERRRRRGRAARSAACAAQRVVAERVGSTGYLAPLERLDALRRGRRPRSAARRLVAEEDHRDPAARLGRARRERQEHARRRHLSSGRPRAPRWRRAQPLEQRVDDLARGAARGSATKPIPQASRSSVGPNSAVTQSGAPPESCCGRGKSAGLRGLVAGGRRPGSSAKIAGAATGGHCRPFARADERQ